MFDIRIKEHRKTLFNEENEKEKKTIELCFLMPFDQRS